MDGLELVHGGLDLGHGWPRIGAWWPRFGAWGWPFFEERALALTLSG